MKFAGREVPIFEKERRRFAIPPDVSDEELIAEPQPRVAEALLADLISAVEEQDGEKLEWALGPQTRLWPRDERARLILQKIATASWHSRHEDIAVVLDGMRHPDSVPTLRAMAEFAEPIWAGREDSSRALWRKAIWAMRKIGTDDAVRAIEALRHNESPRVRELAEYHLAAIRAGKYGANWRS